MAPDPSHHVLHVLLDSRWIQRAIHLIANRRLEYITPHSAVGNP